MGRALLGVGAGRVRAFVVAAAGASFLVIAAVTISNWRQRAWLERVWFFRQPHALAWLLAWSAIAGAAWIAVWAAARAGRARGVPWPALRWIPVLVLGAWSWGLTIPPPALIYDVELAVCAAAALWSVGLAAWAWRRDAPWPRALRTLELVALEIALCVFAAEFALRAARAATDSVLLATPGTDLDAWLRAHRRPPGSFHIGFPVNAAGIVDGEPAQFDPRAALVVCLGDSFSVGVVPHHLHYTTLAEQALGGVEIYNLGVVNAGPREYLRLLESDGLRLKPRLIVVALFIGNDIDEAERRKPRRSANWLDPDEALVRVVPQRLYAIAREGAEAKNVGSAQSGLGVAQRRAFDAAAIERLQPWLADPLREPASFSRGRFLFIEHARTWPLFTDKLPRYAELFRCLDELRAKAQPIPVACLLFPDEFQVDDALWNDLLAEGVSSRAERDLPQRTITAWLDERSVPYVDLLPRLRAATPLSDGALHVFHRNDTHFNARGNALAAQALAELVRRCGVAR